jgi:hypothetical protein
MQRRKMVPWPAYAVVTWPFVVIAVWTLCVCSLIVKKNTMLVEQKKLKKTTYLGGSRHRSVSSCDCCWHGCYDLKRRWGNRRW